MRGLTALQKTSCWQNAAVRNFNRKLCKKLLKKDGSVQKWGFINDKRVENVGKIVSKTFRGLYTKIVVNYGIGVGGGGGEGV